MRGYRPPGRGARQRNDAHFMNLEQFAGKEILAQVRANMAKLDGCSGPHDFQPITEQKFFCRYRCTKCQGEVDSHAKIWYAKGLKHAAPKP